MLHDAILRKSDRTVGLVWRLSIFASLWWCLAGANAESWLVGGATVVAAAVASQALASNSGRRWSLTGCLRFLPYFLVQTIRGSIDVAGRALGLSPPPTPCLFKYVQRLPEGATRVFFQGTINLLPGTLSVDVRGDILTVHMLAESSTAANDLADLESRVASLFRLPLSPEVSGKADSCD